MKLHRFIGDFKLKPGSFKLEDTELINQVRNVLKLSVGEIVILGDGEGNEAGAEIMGYGKDYVEVEIRGAEINRNEADKEVILYCAVLKKENFELVVQKATEIGVKEIVPIITERTIKLNVRQDRLEKIIREAAEQSGRGIVPKLYEPMEFSEATKHSKQNTVNFFFDSSGEGFENFKLKIENSSLGIWIGPEGGWTDRELESAKGPNFKIINLGKLTLRAETAAIVATYIVVHNFYCR